MTRGGLHDARGIGPRVHLEAMATTAPRPADAIARSNPPRGMISTLIGPLITVVGVGWWTACGSVALAQNDWQFPDPRFGTVVGGRRTVTAVDERRYRSQITPAPSPRSRSLPEAGRRTRPRGRFRRR